LKTCGEHESKILGDVSRTMHGDVLCDIADAAIGTAHAASLEEGESFTSIDLQINFFQPVWKERIRAIPQNRHQPRAFAMP
jgi:uncharacterized protein (TIGR00369 family)